jgi:hypothetical protein
VVAALRPLRQSRGDGGRLVHAKSVVLAIRDCVLRPREGAGSTPRVVLVSAPCRYYAAATASGIGWFARKRSSRS